MRHLCFASLLAIPAFLAQMLGTSPSLHAQSEWTVSGGGWIPFMPEYEAASVVGPGGFPVLQENVFQDDLVDFGGQLKLRALYYFTGTRTILESHISIAGLETESGYLNIADQPGSSVWLASLDGTNQLATPDTTSMRVGLESDVLFHDEYIGLRDRFDLTSWGIGELTIGCGFHHMRFDQDFSFGALVSDGSNGAYREELESNFLGGQVVSTISRSVFGRTVMLDTNLGFYRLDADYQGSTRLADTANVAFHTDQVNLTRSFNATTLEIALRTDWNIQSVLVRPSIGMKYISDMPTIMHPQLNGGGANPVSLDSSSAYFLNFGFEILL